MPKIVWCGNQPWDTDFPEVALPGNAKCIEAPKDIFKSSIPYGIFPLVICYSVISVKWALVGEKVLNPAYVPLGVICGLLLMPVHELLHALCYGSGQKVYIGICIEKFAAFAVCHEPVTRKRFIIMCLMPVLLGIIPLGIFLLSPANAILSGICIPLGIIGMLAPMPDYMNVHIVRSRVPMGAYIHTQNDGIYWYSPLDQN